MKIALFVHQPKCSIESSNGVLEALQPYHKFKLFTKWDLDKDFWDDVDCVCIPGGIGDSESWHYLMQNHNDSIQQFIKQGGKYLGICMGAYWADQNYFNLLKDARAVQYITRPKTDTRRPHPKAIDISWIDQKEKMYFYDGCAIVGDDLKFKTIATYANGDPMAVIQDNLGLIGCHPESQRNWYTEYHSWMKSHYHNGKHHQLLLDFVNDLGKQ